MQDLLLAPLLHCRLVVLCLKSQTRCGNVNPLASLQRSGFHPRSAARLSSWFKLHGSSDPILTFCPQWGTSDLRCQHVRREKGLQVCGKKSETKGISDNSDRSDIFRHSDLYIMKKQMAAALIFFFITAYYSFFSLILLTLFFSSLKLTLPFWRPAERMMNALSNKTFSEYWVSLF